jgi:hypothetical protein
MLFTRLEQVHHQKIRDLFPKNCRIGIPETLHIISIPTYDKSRDPVDRQSDIME